MWRVAPPLSMATFRQLIATYLLPDFRLRRILRKAVRGELGTLPDSTLARVTGTVRPFEKRLIEAPLSGRLCVYYVVQVKAANGRMLFTEIGSEHEGMPFLLDDDTAHAVVDPHHAKISVAFDHVSESKAAFDADPRQRAILERLQLIKRDWFTIDHLEYREGVIEADEQIVVLGAGVREPDPDAAPTGMYRDARPLRLRFTGTKKHPLVISDDPKAL